jgi:rhodanese-related sulfurtransferase
VSVSLILFLALVLLYGLIQFRKWMAGRSLTHYTAAELISADPPSPQRILLDVRTSRERSRSSIQGSIHIPLHELRNRIRELERHRNKEIVCYCQSGNRSVTAANMLQREGFTVANLKGGIAEWTFQNRRRS